MIPLPSVVRILGEGGMGAVYEAEQPSPRRRVALKVIRPPVRQPSRPEAFHARRTGRREHAGIARIYEAGTADSGHGLQPFFAMELARGLPLTQYAGHNKLTTRRRLELLARVCDPVQYAPQKGDLSLDAPSVCFTPHYGCSTRSTFC